MGMRVGVLTGGGDAPGLNAAICGLGRRLQAQGAELISRLAIGDLAPIVTDLTGNVPSGWNAIGLPDGSIGYSDALGLDELTPGAICFGRDKGRWKIVATIQRGG